MTHNSNISSNNNSISSSSTLIGSSNSLSIATNATDLGANNVVPPPLPPHRTCPAPPPPSLSRNVSSAGVSIHMNNNIKITKFDN